MSALLEIENLSIGFPHSDGCRRVVDRLSLSLAPGECLALVGESGSGKSISALATLRLHPPEARILGGSVRWAGEDLLDLPEYAMEAIRGRKIGMVFQDPMSALNPVMTVGEQLLEALPVKGRANGRLRILDLLDQVGLPDPVRAFKAYPHQLSGGMRQRVLIAQALAGEPELLIADEPTTALDVLLQAQILALLNQLRKDRGMALWLITHDLAAVHEVADRVLVMREGQVVEAAGPDFFEGPQTPYGQMLLEAIPRLSACLAAKDRESPSPPEGPLLRLQNLSIGYPTPRRFWAGKDRSITIVENLTLNLDRGETLAIVGGSGCGKTTLARGLLGLAEVTAGEVAFHGRPISRDGRQRIQPPGIQVVFQDPYAAMNPRMIISRILDEGLRATSPELSEADRQSQVLSCLEAVGLDREVLERYPHEFSGGQRQRLCIARSLVLKPQILILDEPTSALDVTVQAQVLALLQSLRDQHGLSYLFITHDLGVVAKVSDRMAVMAKGQIVELGRTRDILQSPQHPITQGLIKALPALRRDL